MHLSPSMVPPGSVKIVKTMAAVLLQRHVVTSSEISGVRRHGQNMRLQALGEADVHLGGCWAGDVCASETRDRSPWILKHQVTVLLCCVPVTALPLGPGSASLERLPSPHVAFRSIVTAGETCNGPLPFSPTRFPSFPVI